MASDKNKGQGKNYIPPNIMTSTVLPTDRLDAGQIFCLYTGYSPMQNATQLTNPDYEMVRTTEALTSTGYVQERMWAVPVTSKKPEKAIEFLNLLYTNDALANLLMNGVEDLHYTRVSDHVIAHTDNMEYHRIFNFFGNEQHCDQWLPATEETISAQIGFENSAMKTLTMGYTFDSSVERELEAVDEVIAAYAPALECGKLDGYGFVPYMINYLLEDPSQAKGNILLFSGRSRTNDGEAFPTAPVFNELGYNCFVVNNRMALYTTQDSDLDTQRAIRLVKAQGAEQGWGGQDMIVDCG